MTPDRCSSMAGRKPRSRRTAENKFNSNSCRQISSVNARTPPPGAEEPPTPLIKMSRPPRRSSVILITWSDPARVLPSDWMNCSGLAPAGVVLAVASTVAPPRSRRFTMASPIPLVPPVTRTRLPLNSCGSQGMLGDLMICKSALNVGIHVVALPGGDLIGHVRDGHVQHNENDRQPERT